MENKDAKYSNKIRRHTSKLKIKGAIYVLILALSCGKSASTKNVKLTNLNNRNEIIYEYTNNEQDLINKGWKKAPYTPDKFINPKNNEIYRATEWNVSPLTIFEEFNMILGEYYKEMGSDYYKNDLKGELIVNCDKEEFSADDVISELLENDINNCMLLNFDFVKTFPIKGDETQRRIEVFEMLKYFLDISMNGNNIDDQNIFKKTNIKTILANIALGRYYYRMGNGNYYKENGQGKFLAFCNDKNINAFDIEDEKAIGTLVEFDGDFPLEKEYLDKKSQISKKIKDAFIFGHVRYNEKYELNDKIKHKCPVLELNNFKFFDALKNHPEKKQKFFYSNKKTVVIMATPHEGLGDVTAALNIAKEFAKYNYLPAICLDYEYWINNLNKSICYIYNYDPNCSSDPVALHLALHSSNSYTYHGMLSTFKAQIDIIVEEANKCDNLLILNEIELLNICKYKNIDKFVRTPPLNANIWLWDVEPQYLRKMLNFNNVYSFTEYDIDPSGNKIVEDYYNKKHNLIGFKQIDTGLGKNAKGIYWVAPENIDKIKSNAKRTINNINSNLPPNVDLMYKEGDFSGV